MKNLDIKITEAVPEDAEAWANIRKVAWLATYPNQEADINREDILLKDFDSPEKIKMWQDSFVNINDRFYLSAKVGGNVVGILIGYPYGEMAEIGAIYVHPEYHVKGVGKALMNEAISRFDEKKKIKLNVVEYNVNAINFYKKLGFKVVGQIKDDFGILPNGKILPEIEMIRE